MNTIFLTERQTSIPIVTSIVLNRLGKKVNIYDLTENKLLRFVKPDNMDFPYNYSNETMIDDKIGKTEADVTFYVVDNEKLIPETKEPVNVVIVTDMYIRNARLLAYKFRHFLRRVKNEADEQIKLSLVVENYTDTKYSHRAIQDAIGVTFPSDSVSCISYSSRNVYVDISIDLAGKVRLNAIGRDYKQAITNLLYEELQDNKLRKKVFK